MSHDVFGFSGSSSPLSAPHVVFAGGGTAGHLFPGLATAAALRKRLPDARITFSGTGKPLERARVEAAGYEYLTLAASPLPRRPAEAWRFVTHQLSGYYVARRFLRLQPVDLVVGLGGYASVPMARAARRLRVPYLLLEQNVTPGRATRWLASGAELVCLSWEEARGNLSPKCTIRVTGNPIDGSFSRRPNVRRWSSEAVEAERPRRLLVLGGSGGARTINQQAPRAIYKAQAALAGWQIIHQTGERDFVATRELYEKLGIAAKVAPFFEQMPKLLRHTHLAVSRAGGTTLAELMAAAVPSILLPYPQATDDHQRRNADRLASAGAALVIDQREVEGRLDNCLAQSLMQLATNRALCRLMSEQAFRLSRPSAADQVAQVIVRMLPQRQVRQAA